MARLPTVLLLLVIATPSHAQTCPSGSCLQTPGCNDVARPVDPELWGTLRPFDVDTVPIARDLSWWNGLGVPLPQFIDLAPAGDGIAVAVGRGLQLWHFDGDSTFGRHSHFAFDEASGLHGTHRMPPELKVPFWRIASLPAQDLVAVGGQDTGGVVFVDVSQPAAPQPLAQLHGLEVLDLGFAERDQPWLFAAVTGHDLPSGGVLLRLGVPTSTGGAPCLATLASPGCGLAPALIPDTGRVTRVATEGEFVVGAGLSLGVRGWRIDTNGELRRLLELDLPVTGAVADVALWRHGGQLVLASLSVRAVGPTLELRDVTCLARGGCGFTPPLLSSRVLPQASRLTFSERDGRPHLAVLPATQCSGGSQREWVFDTSDPTNPIDLTPPDGVLEGQPTGYWGWYYPLNPTGTFAVAPSAGLWSNGGYVRAAGSLLDLHLATDTLRADFDVDRLVIFAGDEVQLVSTSAGAPLELSWDFGDDGGTDATGPTASFVASAPGPMPVRLIVGDGTSSSSRLRVLEILEACPALETIVSPGSGGLCTTSSFDARGNRGQDPSVVAWSVEHPTLGTVALATGVEPFLWTPGPGLEGATPEVVVHATATSGSCAPSSVNRSFSLTEPAPPVAPTVIHTSSIGPGRVRFTAGGGSGLEWSWDFDDDIDPQTREWTAWAPAPSPATITHQYQVANPTADGLSREVRVRLRTCIADPVESAPRPLYVETVDPISILSFRVGCPDPVCEYLAGEPVPFELVVEGPILSYHFDWLGDTTEIEIRPTPATTHTYCWDMPVEIHPHLEVTGWGVSAQRSTENRLVVLPGPGCAPPPAPPLFLDSFESGDIESWQ